MFGFSFWEIAIILAVALIILGPTKLPELAKTLGRGIREFRRATDDFKAQVDHEMMDEPEVEPAPALPSGHAARNVAASPETVGASPETVGASPETVAASETESDVVSAWVSDPVAGLGPAEKAPEALERPRVEEKKADA